MYVVSKEVPLEQVKAKANIDGSCSLYYHLY